MKHLETLELQTDLALRAFNLATDLADEDPDCPYFEALRLESLRHYTRLNDLYLEAMRIEITKLKAKAV